MARALAYRIQEADADGDTLSVTLSVLFYGADLPASLSNPVTFDLGGTDTLTQMRDKAVTAVVAKGTQLGLTVARSSVVVPSLARGV
jgi:hypothetical protein